MRIGRSLIALGMGTVLLAKENSLAKKSLTLAGKSSKMHSVLSGRGGTGRRATLRG